MTSALSGEGGLENWLILRTNSTDRLREMRTRGGLKSQKFCRRHKWMAPYFVSYRGDPVQLHIPIGSVFLSTVHDSDSVSLGR